MIKMTKAKFKELSLTAVAYKKGSGKYGMPNSMLYRLRPKWWHYSHVINRTILQIP